MDNIENNASLIFPSNSGKYSAGLRGFKTRSLVFSHSVSQESPTTSQVLQSDCRPEIGIRRRSISTPNFINCTLPNSDNALLKYIKQQSQSQTSTLLVHILKHAIDHKFHTSIAHIINQRGKSLPSLYKQHQLEALHHAINAADLTTTKRLVKKYGSEILSSALGTNGKIALHEAIEKGHTHLIKYILEADKIGIVFVDKVGNNCTHLAALKRDNTIVELIAKYAKNSLWLTPNNAGKTATDLVISTEQWSILHILFEYKVDLISYRDNNKNSLAHIAIKHHQLPLLKKIVHTYHNQILFSSNNEGDTTLHLAIKQSDGDSVDYLLKKDKTLALQFNREKGQSPAHLAVDNDNVAVLEKLIKATSTKKILSCENRDHFNVVKVIMQKQAIKCVKLLCELDQNKIPHLHGKSIAHLAAEHSFLAAVERIIVQKFGISILLKQDDNGDTPLHIAARHNHPETTKLMFQQAPDTIKIKNTAGQTPLMLAERHGQQSHTYQALINN